MLIRVPPPIFAGDGETARRVRDLDWSRTPLGPVASWPQSSAVSICLVSRFPIVLHWGPQFVVL